MFPSITCLFGLAGLSVLSLGHASPLPSHKGWESQHIAATFTVGFDLAVDYATASIRYADGSFLDVTKIEASDEYKRLMRRLVDDATAESPPPPPPPSPVKVGREQQQMPLDSRLRNLQASRWRHDENMDQACACKSSTIDASLSSERSPDRCDHSSNVLSDIQILGLMLSQLRDAAESQLCTPLTNLAVSIPTIISLSTSTLNAALASAGLQSLIQENPPLKSASAAVLGVNGASQPVDNALGLRILVLEYYPFALISTVKIDGEESLPAATLNEAAGSIARYAHTFSSERNYWKYVKQAIQRMPVKMSSPPVDIVVAVGEDASNERFAEVLNEAADELSPGLLKRPKLLQQNPLFSVARGAATVAAQALEDAATHLTTGETDDEPVAPSAFTELR